MLIIDKETFGIGNKNLINNENGELQYWTQPDFSYKKRLHIYDKNDNEIGYVQYKILSCQEGNGFFSKEDKQINLDEWNYQNDKSEWNYDVYYKDALMSRIVNDDYLIKITINDDSYINECLFMIFGKIS